MASVVLLNISRNEVERVRLESEYKAAIDIQSRLVDERREAIAEAHNGILELIAKGYTTADIKRHLEGGR